MLALSPIIASKACLLLTRRIRVALAEGAPNPRWPAGLARPAQPTGVGYAASWRHSSAHRREASALMHSAAQAVHIWTHSLTASRALLNLASVN